MEGEPAGREPAGVARPLPSAGVVFECRTCFQATFPIVPVSNGVVRYADADDHVQHRGTHKRATPR